MCWKILDSIILYLLTILIKNNANTPYNRWVETKAYNELKEMIYLDFFFCFSILIICFRTSKWLVYEEYLSFKYRLLLLLNSLTRVMLMIGLCNWLLCKRPSRLENIAIYRILLTSLNFSMFCLPWMYVQQMISLHLFASEIFKEMFSKCLSEREREWLSF